jgi:hypothetical protein
MPIPTVRQNPKATQFAIALVGILACIAAIQKGKFPKLAAITTEAINTLNIFIPLTSFSG